MPKMKMRSLPVWLLGGPNQVAKRVRAALKPGEDLRRYDVDSLPGAAEYARDEPLAVFVDLEMWRGFLSGRLESPAWLNTSRRILVDAGEESRARAQEVLAHGFLCCLTLPLAKAKVRHALDLAEKNVQALAEVSSVLDEALRQRDSLAKENGRLAFFQHMLTQAMTTLDLGDILAQVGDALAQAYPVTEILGVFWDESSENQLYLPSGLAEADREQRISYLLGLAERLRGGPVGGYLVREIPAVAASLAGMDPRRALLVPLRKDRTAFGCLVAHLERDLARQEQETIRQAVDQVLPCLGNALAYARLRRKADLDGLTGLFNRRSFDARLSMELKRHLRHREAFSLVLVDLDDFKSVNDTFGHQAGDAALKLVSQILGSDLRDTDMAARYGGEEFALILPHTGQAQAWMLAERLRREVAGAKLRHGGRDVPLTMSVGVAGFVPGEAVTEAGLIQAADKALYAAKAAGKNRVVVARKRSDVPRQAAGGLQAV
ncbi:GGDEF domain-containing protein [Fundidesulfovibrio butyratiphilus]